MPKYDTNKQKIDKSWQEVIKNKSNVNNLKKGTIKNVQVNYIEKINKYIIYEGPITTEDPIIFKVNLNNFPEIALPYIKIIPISNSIDSIVESYILDTQIYIYYRGIATNINIYLIIKFPQDYNQISSNTFISGTGVRG